MRSCFHQAFVNTVAADIGVERATALTTKMGEASGCCAGWAGESAGRAGRHEGLRRNSGTPGMQPVRRRPWHHHRGHGARRSRSCSTQVGRCPVFEAARLHGPRYSKPARAGCRAGAIKFMDTVVKQLNPNLRYELRKYRSAPGGFLCRGDCANVASSEAQHCMTWCRASIISPRRHFPSGRDRSHRVARQLA